MVPLSVWQIADRRTERKREREADLSHRCPPMSPVSIGSSPSTNTKAKMATSARTASTVDHQSVDIVLVLVACAIAAHSPQIEGDQSRSRCYVLVEAFVVLLSRRKPVFHHPHRIPFLRLPLLRNSPIMTSQNNRLAYWNPESVLDGRFKSVWTKRSNWSLRIRRRQIQHCRLFPRWRRRRASWCSTTIVIHRSSNARKPSSDTSNLRTMNWMKWSSMKWTRW